MNFIGARRAVKRVSIWMYCRRLLRATAVTWLFAKFELRGL